MKNVTLIILFFIFCSFNSNADSTAAGVDTTFEEFIANFKEVKLPLKLNFISLSQDKGHKKIGKETVEKFLCKNNGKDCFWDDKGNTKKYFYLFKYKISDTLIALVYEEAAGEENMFAHVIIANIQTKNITSQLVIAGRSMEQHFEVSSDINLAFEIQVKTVSLKEGVNPEEKDPAKQKFKVQEVKEMVKVERTGKLKKLKKLTNFFNGMIDASNQNKIIYPVE